MRSESDKSDLNKGLHYILELKSVFTNEQASTSMLRQLRDDASDSVHIENNGVD